MAHVRQSQPRVCVLIPSGAQWEANFGYDLAKCMAYTASAGVSLNIYTVNGSILPQNRDLLVKAGQESGATHYMWFDDDMRFPKDSILRLLEHDNEIVCANYRFRNSPEKFVSYTKGKGYIEIFLEFFNLSGEFDGHHNQTNKTRLHRYIHRSFRCSRLRTRVFRSSQKLTFS